MIPCEFDPAIEDQRNLLANAIEDAVKRVGIAHQDAELNGPQLLMMLDDLVVQYLELQKQVDAKYYDTEIQ